MLSDRIFSLLHKLEERTISVKEMDELQKWIHQAPELRQRYSSKVDAAWSDMQVAIKKEANRNNLLNRPTYWISAAAATLLILCIVGNWAYTKRAITVYANNGLLHHILPDSSSVVISEGSSLSYTKRFGKSNRVISLKGKAFFDVEKDPQVPFIIKANESVTTVLGTSFYLSSSDSIITLEVIEGRVSFKTKGTKELIKIQGQSLSYFSNRKQIIENLPNTTNANYWHTGELSFSEASLSSAVSQIAEAYNTVIKIEGDTRKCTLTSTFSQDNITDVLDIISITYNTSWNKKNNVYIINPINCN